MSCFRPTRKVTDPRGREWEIYVSRFAVPNWEPNDYDSFVDNLPPFGPFLLLGLLALVWELPRFLYHQLLMPLWRFLVDVPFAIVRGRRSHTVWIEAISWGIDPHRDSILWTTTPDHLGRVLDQVTAGLAAGEVTRPLGGLFQGQQSR